MTRTRRSMKMAPRWREGEDDSKCGETEDEENDFRRTRRSWGGNRGRNNEAAILQLTAQCRCPL